MNSIFLQDVTIGYHGNVIAESLTTTLRGGEMTCLIGRNGLGKSTLLKVLAGFVPPLAGNIRININGRDYDLLKMSKSLVSHFIAVVLTERIDIANATAAEVIAMGRMPYTGFFGKLGKEDKRIVGEAMESTGTGNISSRDFATLSDGERQKVMIARAIAQQTPVILLDEPTSFLDYDSKTQTLRLLQSIAHDMGKIILASTHDLDIAIRTADRLITIDGGIKDISPAILKNKMENS